MPNQPYAAPTLIGYGTVSQITGDFGVSGANDIYLKPDGQDDPTRNTSGSIDGCAQEQSPSGGLKCICSDNGNC